MIYDDFSKSKYLEKVLATVADQKPKTYEALVAMKGVGPKTVRALALVGEVIYGAAPSYEDPARYSFAHGGKDATPYPWTARPMTRRSRCSPARCGKPDCRPTKKKRR